MTLSADAHKRLSRGEGVAAQLTARRSGYLRFIVVRVFKEGSYYDPGYRDRPWRYRAYEYELRAELLDEVPSFDLLEDFRDARPEDLPALVLLLAEWAPAADFRDNREVGAPF